MSQDLYSIEQVAERLNLHVRTVRGYVRDGKLKAIRIGKQYRIARDDLEAFTGTSAATSSRGDPPRHRHVEVSSIVQIDAISGEEASQMSNFLTAAAKGRLDGEAPLRIEAIYEEVRAHLKVIILGDLSATAALIDLIALRLRQPRS